MNVKNKGNDTAATSDYLFDKDIDPSRHFGDMTRSGFSNITALKGNGAGPFSLYKATRSGKRFTLKCLSQRYQSDPNFNLIQKKEFDIGAALEHPNIRTTIGIEDVNGLGRAIILEYVDGESLDMAMQNGRVTKTNVRQIVAQIADALEYVHSKQVVHGDIKPANILVTFTGCRVKLIDFSLSDSDAYVILKNPGGTKDYIAPEMLVPGASPSVKADIYSFGKVASELAEYAGDELLLKAARRYCHQNPDRRQASPAAIKLTENLSSWRQSWRPGSRRLTHVLLTAALCLCVLIAALTLGRVAHNQNEAAPSPADPSGIQVVDMEHLFPNDKSDS